MCNNTIHVYNLPIISIYIVVALTLNYTKLITCTNYYIFLQPQTSSPPPVQCAHHKHVQQVTYSVQETTTTTDDSETALLVLFFKYLYYV